MCLAQCKGQSSRSMYTVYVINIGFISYANELIDISWHFILRYRNIVRYLLGRSSSKRQVGPMSAVQTSVQCYPPPMFDAQCLRPTLTTAAGPSNRQCRHGEPKLRQQCSCHLQAQQSPQRCRPKMAQFLCVSTSSHCTLNHLSPTTMPPAALPQAHTHHSTHDRCSPHSRRARPANHPRPRTGRPPRRPSPAWTQASRHASAAMTMPANGLTRPVTINNGSTEHACWTARRRPAAEWPSNQGLSGGMKQPSIGDYHRCSALSNGRRVGLRVCVRLCCEFGLCQRAMHE